VRSVTVVTAFQEDVIVWLRAPAFLSVTKRGSDRLCTLRARSRAPRNVISGLQGLDYSRWSPKATGVVVRGAIIRENLQRQEPSKKSSAPRRRRTATIGLEVTT
jgi:hypothetical protein